jgi:tripartite motif-containing protein 71
VFTCDGSYVRQWGSEGAGDGQFKGPVVGVAISPVTGEVYVTENKNRRVQVFT